jgi:hypothetical protein
LRRLAHKLAELVRSVQGGAGMWSSARWQDGAIVVNDGHGAPPCEHKFRAFRDHRGHWTGKATCIYCKRGTSWKTKEANAARVRKPYTAPTVRDVELADLPSQTTPRALRAIEDMVCTCGIDKFGSWDPARSPWNHARSCPLSELFEASASGERRR